jgi:hypothetical protein
VLFSDQNVLLVGSSVSNATRLTEDPDHFRDIAAKEHKIFFSFAEVRFLSELTVKMRIGLVAGKIPHLSFLESWWHTKYVILPEASLGTNSLNHSN